ncbi:MAG: hypothetical protein U0Z44_07520 [Kouleothrix sp.]
MKIDMVKVPSGCHAIYETFSALATYQYCQVKKCLISKGGAGPPSLQTPPGTIFVALLIGIQESLSGLALWQYSSLPTGSDGSIVFRQRYLPEHYRFLVERLETFSYWSGKGIQRRKSIPELGFYLMELINAAVLQISTWTTLSPKLIHQFILTASLITLSLYLLLCGKMRRQPIFNIAVIAGLSTLGTPVIINFLTGWNVAYAWLLMLGVAIVSTSNLPPAWRLGLTIALAIMAPPLYHTFGFLFTTFVVFLWIFSRLIGLRQIVASPIPVLVCYFSYQIYVSVQFFGELTTGIADVLTLEFLRREQNTPDIASASAGPIDLRYFHLLLFTLLALPIAIAVFRFVRIIYTHLNNKEIDYSADEIRYLTVTTAMSAAVVFFAIMFGTKSGFGYLVNRGTMYMGIPAVIAVTAELRYRHNHYRYVYPLTVVLITMSLFSFWVQSSTVYATNYATNTEAEGYVWLKERLSDEDVVFTDFRLSGLFISDGHFRVIGVTGQKGENTPTLLNDIYYKSTPTSITEAIDRIRTNKEVQPANYLFLSSLMQEEYPGLNGFGRIFPAAPEGFFETLKASPDWELVFHNSQTYLSA